MPNFQRVQRKRTAGAKLPAGTLVCTRGTPLGNPFVGEHALEAWRTYAVGCLHPASHPRLRIIADVAARSLIIQTWFGPMQYQQTEIIARILPPLEFRKALTQARRSRKFACYCSLEQPCHVDTFPELFDRLAALENPA